MKPDKGAINHKDIRLSRLAVVEWRDATSRQGWNDELSEPEDALTKMVSVGWLLRLGKDAVVLAKTVTVLNDFGDTLTIPRAWIQRIYRIHAIKQRLPKRRRRRGRR